MERLQTSYMNLGGLAPDYIVTLNTNYRCHKDLAKIPNDLFYESKVKSYPHDAIPHPKAAFPLFFVCSSLTEMVDPRLEAKILLERVDWPVDWGTKDFKNVCIVTASQTQVG